MRHDTLFTRIGDRSDRGLGRLWIEESSGRLAANGFATGQGFLATPRAGVGLVLTPALLATTHVSARRDKAILSFESPGLAGWLHTAEVRVRIHVKAIVAMPSLRLFSVRAASDETWTIRGTWLHRPIGAWHLVTPSPIGFRTSPARLEIDLTEENLVYATEVAGNAKPGVIVLRGDSVLTAVAKQFLLAAGYGENDDGTLVR